MKLENSIRKINENALNDLFPKERNLNKIKPKMSAVEKSRRRNAKKFAQEEARAKKKGKKTAY